MATQPTDSRRISRRLFCGQSASGLGLIALAHVLGEDLSAQGGAAAASAPNAEGGVAGLPHFPARAKRVIYLFQSGGPSHLDLFDVSEALDFVSGISNANIKSKSAENAGEVDLMRSVK